MIRSAIFGFCLLFVTPLFSVAEQINRNDQAIVLEAVIAHLENDYVDPVIGQRAAYELRHAFNDRSSLYYLEGDLFARELSQTLQTLTGDGHLNVEYSQTLIPIDSDIGVSFAAEELDHYYGAHLNFGVQQVARLDGNVGLIDLRVFAPIEMGASTVTAAMNTVANMDALIIDLRSNGGGMGDMADLVASYLFGPDRQPLTGTYDRPSDTLTQRFTLPYVPGERFGADKPVYVLISSKTFSAAEALAYNLQALGRATIVGEISGGGAHPFDYVRIHDHFILWSVTAKSIHPVTQSNWQSVGVQPDILTDAENALDAALDHLSRSVGAP